MNPFTLSFIFQLLLLVDILAGPGRYYITLPPNLLVSDSSFFTFSFLYKPCTDWCEHSLHIYNLFFFFFLGKHNNTSLWIERVRLGMNRKDWVKHIKMGWMIITGTYKRKKKET